MTFTFDMKTEFACLNLIMALSAMIFKLAMNHFNSLNVIYFSYQPGIQTLFLNKQTE